MRPSRLAVLAGKRVAYRSALVIGPGPVAGRIAVMLRVAGMTVDGAGRHSRRGTGAFRKIVASSSLAEVATGCDLIDAGRGEIVDEHALAATLSEGRPLRNVVDKRGGYVGSASLVGTSREGGIG
jgi:phosphoglycerate dehydrogenase-like enzyme